MSQSKLFTKNVFHEVILITLIYIIIVSVINTLLYALLGEYILLNMPFLFLSIESLEYVIYFIIIYYLRRCLFQKRLIFDSVFNVKSLSVITIAILCVIFVDFLHNFEYIFTEDKVSVTSTKSYSTSVHVFYIINTVVFTPILEELIFRRVVLEKLLSKVSVLKSVLFSAFLFSLIHINFLSIEYNVNLVISFIIGVVLGIMYLKYGILYCILFHLCYNLLTFILVTYQYEYWLFIKFLDFNVGYWVIEIISLVLIVYMLKGGRGDQDGLTTKSRTLF